MGDVKKVAILGGGVGAMTAAWWLTEKSRFEPDGPRYDITVYQMGWRLGGKGASGRNMTPGYGSRIEEHGMHLWMGFYANAFRMIKKVYKDLNRPPGSPMREWTDAFSPLDVAYNLWNPLLKWDPWELYFPPNGGDPGDIPRFRLPCEFLQKIPPFLRPFVDLILKILTDLVDPPPLPSGKKIDIAKAIDRVTQLAAQLKEMEENASCDPLENHEHAAVHKNAKSAQEIIAELLTLLSPVDELMQILSTIDLGVAIVVGIIRHLHSEQSWLAIEGQNWKQWLLDNGLCPINQWCPMIRVVYELLFAFHDGKADEDSADLSATWGVLGVLRMVFEYQGHFYWKMNAGMGDIIFAPLYLVLLERGVKFEFFHRVRELVPCEPGCPKHEKGSPDRCIAEVRIGVQATPLNGQYQPLIDVPQHQPGVTGTLPCWPATPLYDQLVNGQSIESMNVDFEKYDARWPDAGEKVLRMDQDYDWVVYGMSLGSVRHVCPFWEDDPRWKNMVEKVGTVRTQAFQLWMNQETPRLGWRPQNPHGERALTGGFVEPLDTWGNWTQVLDSEDWPTRDYVKTIQYFCGPAREGLTTDIVMKNAIRLMRFDFHWIWPYAYDEIGEFNWNYLSDPENRTGPDRFASQFFRANTEPSELYVQSFAGTLQYRLGHDNGFSNLCLVGDWTNNPFPVGCVEGAVIGAMHGIEPITGPLPIVK